MWTICETLKLSDRETRGKTYWSIQKTRSNFKNVLTSPFFVANIKLKLIFKKKTGFFMITLVFNAFLTSTFFCLGERNFIYTCIKSIYLVYEGGGVFRWNSYTNRLKSNRFFQTLQIDLLPPFSSYQNSWKKIYFLEQ